VFADSPKATDLPFKVQGRVHRKFSSTLRSFGLTQARDPADGIVRWGLDHQTTERLQHLGREKGASFYVVRLAAFVALLANECEVEDVILATYVSTRNQLSLQTIYGLFVNVVLLRFCCDQSICFREWLDIVRKRALEFRAHSAMPFDQLREGLRREGVQLPNTGLVFNVANPRKVFSFSGVKLYWSDQYQQTMPSGLAMNPDSYSETTNCRTLFDAYVYDATSVRRFVERYRRLLAAVSRDPDLSISELLSIDRHETEPNLALQQ